MKDCKHKNITKTTDYIGMDCNGYEIVCKDCGLRCSSFSLEECELKWKKITTKENCKFCLGLGIYNTPNGEDDSDTEYCKCPVGAKKAQEDNEDLEIDHTLLKREKWLKENGRKDSDVMMDDEGKEYVIVEGEEENEKYYLPEELKIKS